MGPNSNQSNYSHQGYGFGLHQLSATAKDISDYTISLSMGIVDATMNYAARGVDIGAGSLRAVGVGLSGIMATLDVGIAFNNWRSGIGPASEIGSARSAAPKRY